MYNIGASDALVHLRHNTLALKSLLSQAQDAYECINSNLCAIKTAYEQAEENERNPRNKLLERRKEGNERMHANPAEHRHKRLKEGKGSRNKSDFSRLHSGLVKSCNKRYRKGIHGKTDSKHYGGYKKCNIKIHKKLLKIKKCMA